ncbi:MAG: hypothetical protein AAGA21_12110 [Pseudomonadota bacterium]
MTAPAQSDILALIKIGDNECIVRLGADGPMGSGAKTSLTVDMAKGLLFDLKTEQRLGI